MSINSIKNDDDLKAVFIRLESIFQTEDGMSEADERETLVAI